MKFIVTTQALIMAAVLAILATEANAQFREDSPWRFDTPNQTQSKLNLAVARELKKGNYYKGSHANKSVSIGSVYIRDANGNLQLTDQSVTNIGTYSIIEQSGDGNLTVDSDQDSGTQVGSNVSRQQGAGDTGGDFNGSSGSDGGVDVDGGGGS